jgi:hypothetical protein
VANWVTAGDAIFWLASGALKRTHGEEAIRNPETIARLTAAREELMQAMQDGQVGFSLWHPADLKLAEPNRKDSSFWRRSIGLDLTDNLAADVRLSIDDWIAVQQGLSPAGARSRPSARNAGDRGLPLVFVDFDQVRKLRRKSADPPQGEATKTPITPRPGYTVEDYQKARAWLLAWPRFNENRGDEWFKLAVAGAKEAGIRMPHELLKSVISQYPDLQARARKTAIKS